MLIQGALPYLVGKCGLSCPVYATTPVFLMGQMFMYDLYQSRRNQEDFNLFSLDDVDAAFDKVIQLKYNQTVILKGKGQGLTLTPMPAGHMIGGTIWRIVKDGEEDIIYGIDYNHKKERHLNGCMLETIHRPSLLITDAYNATYQQERRRKRDEQLLTNILTTLRNGGNVLIAVDTAGRVLELGHMLDQLWRNQDSGLSAYSLALLNNFSYNVMEFAKSHVEWMSDKIMKSFEGQRSNPFQFRHLTLCHKLQDLSRIPDPKVVLASQPDLESGFSRNLLFQWASNPLNSIILTQRCSDCTLAAKLIEWSGNIARSQRKPLEPLVLTLDVSQRIPLEGSELEEYMRQEKLKNQQAKNHTGKEHESESSEESESEGEETKAKLDGLASSSLNASKQVKGHSSEAKHDLMMRPEGKSKGGGFFKQAKKSYPMYPANEPKLKWDDYGEIINPEEFIIFDANATTSANANENADADKENLDEEKFEQQEPPTKCIKETKTFVVNAKVEFIDFEGRSDGESIKKIISMIRPRRLVLVRGCQQATEHLANYCRVNNIVSTKIFTPAKNEIVDATTESHIYQVKLKDSLVTSLTFSRAKDGAELAWIDAEIEMKEEESLLPQTEEEAAAAAAALSLKKASQDSQRSSSDVNNQNDYQDSNGESGGRELLPSLKSLPPSETPSHLTLFVNELKLSDFKQVLTRNNLPAEFSGGILFVGNHVAVRRTEAGRIHIEGCLSPYFFQVRQLLYQQYAII